MAITANASVAGTSGDPPNSEYKAQAELYVPFRATESRSYLAKLCAGNIGDRVLQGGVIKDVVELGPELEVVFLQKTSVLDQREVCIDTARSTQIRLAQGVVRNSKGGRGRKAGRVEPVVLSLAAREHGVAQTVGTA